MSVHVQFRCNVNNNLHSSLAKFMDVKLMAIESQPYLCFVYSFNRKHDLLI